MPRQSNKLLITLTVLFAPIRIMARILLIEDDYAVRTMLRLALTHFSHAVIEACNGEEGIEFFKQTKVDLVITDIVMPKKEGLDVLMELRTKQAPPVKIIVISGGGRLNASDNLHMTKLLGAAKVMAKPFSIEVLIAAINELLPPGNEKSVALPM